MRMILFFCVTFAACEPLAAAEDNSKGENQSLVQSRIDTVAVPIPLMQHLDLDKLLAEDLIKEFGTDNSPIAALASATGSAKQKQISSLVDDRNMIKLTLASTVTLPALEEKDIAASMSLFRKTLSSGIVGDAKVFFELWARRILEKEFGARTTIRLIKRGSPTVNGVKEALPSSTWEALHTPPRLRGYEIHLSLDGKDGHSERVFAPSHPHASLRFDFLDIVTENDK